MEQTETRSRLAASVPEPTAARERELAGLLAAAQAVLKHRSFAAAARVIFDHCRDLIGAPAGYISLSNEAGDANEVVFLEAGGLPCNVDPLAPMPIRGLRAEAYETGQPVYDNHFAASPHQAFLPDGHVRLENVLFAPLNSGGKTVGLLGLANKPGGFTENDRRLAAGFAELAAIALVNSRAEEAVRRSEAQLSLIADSLPVLIAYVDREQRFRFANLKYREWFGLDPEQVVGRTMASVLGEELYGQVHPYTLQALAGQPADFQRPHRLPDGKILQLHKRYIPHRGEDGEVQGFFLLAEDITARLEAEDRLKQAHDTLEQRVEERTAVLKLANEQLRREMAQRRQVESRLRESESRYRTLLQTAASAVMSLCPTGRILEFNDEAERLSGWGREEVRGLDAFSLFVKEEDQPQAREKFAGVLAGETVRGLEMLLLRKDGSEQFFLVSAHLVRDAAGQPAEVLVVGQDITDRREAQTALEAERQRLFALLDHLPAYVFLQDAAHKVKFANRYFRENFGEPKGRACHEILWGREEPCKECPTAEVFHTGKPHVWEWTRPDGRTYQIYDYPFADLDGSPLVLEMGIDITARKRAEEALKEQSRIMEAFFAHTITPLVFLDRDFNYLRVNEAYAQACGREVADFAGRNYFELFAQPENQAIFNQVVRTKKPHVALARPFLFPDHPEWGVTYWDWTLVPILDEAGEVDFLVLSSQDVTEKVRAEETHSRLIAILEATPDLVGISDVSRRVLYLNQAGRRLLGLSAQGELGPLDFLQFLPHDIQELVLHGALPAARAQGVWQGETTMRSKDGRKIPVSQVIIVHRDQDGREQFYSTIARDISERRQAEAQLRLLTSQLLTAQEQERRRLSRELHDELGQSLLVLKMQIRALERRLQDPLSQGDCDRSLHYIDEIIDNVRRLSRDLSPAILDDLGLSAALRHLLDEFRRHYELPHIHAEAEMVDDLLSREAQINLYRVLQESLTNIAKHARASRVVIRLKRQDDHIVGSVEDDGQGFDLAALRLEADPLRGLGLTAMEERLRILGGAFQVHSQPGAGTRISFSLLAQREQGGS